MNVYIVGAGPGDSGLLTLRAKEIINRAEVVIYDRLVSDSVLAMIPENAELIDAGKSSSFHKISQREIESLIIKHAKTGKITVRLKGGDPFLFGRGGEEADSLIKAGINFEIVPGVSSALAVPEWAGIPVTHRDYCSGLNIFTAHDRNNLLPDFTRTTKIFLMGVANSEILQNKLLSENLSPDTSCAIIENGTSSQERIIRTELNNLHEAIIANKINPPAIIIIGDTAKLNYSWRKKLPLHDKKIIITRPAGRSENLAALLRDSGAEVVLMPAIKTQIISDSLTGKNLSGYDYIGFTSVTGVEAFFKLLRDSNRDIREIGGAKIAAIGLATAEALHSHGLRVDFVPEIYDCRHLAEGLAGKILMLRALNGSPEIAEIFDSRNINYDEICIYRIDYVKFKHVPKFADFIIFTSASTVKGFAMNTNNLREVIAICIGEQTAKEAINAGFMNVRISKQATVKSIYDAVMSCL